MKTAVIFVILLNLFSQGYSNDDFVLIDQWTHKLVISGRAFFITIDKDNHIVGTFYKIGNRIITPDEIIEFAPRGQRPGELLDILALFPYKNGLALMERPELIKTFRKENGTYKYSESIWLKRDALPHFVQNGIYAKNKWFFSGLNIMKMEKKKFKVSYLKVYDDKGKELKNLIFEEYDKLNQFYRMDYYICSHKEHIFFLAENELKLTIICPNELRILKEVPLTKPPFYKEMPDSFYKLNTAYKSPQDFLKDGENWKTSYSIINKVVIDNNYLVLQLRSCNDNLKKFSLLFYNANTYQLEKTLFTNDLLLGIKEGKFYFYANGDPGLDEEANQTIINIYELKEEK